MSREIKFRGKRKDNGEWEFGNLFIDKDLDTYTIQGYEYYSDSDGLQREPFQQLTIKETVGQFTGLHDKNGVEIYEGDLIEVNRPDKHFISEIVWNESFGCYEFKDGENSWCGLDAILISDTGKSIYGKFTKVIGNIHERSE